MIDRAARFLKDLLNGTSFHRGLALGALVGAAIAGSTLWTRVREAREARDKARRPSAGRPPDDLPVELPGEPPTEPPTEAETVPSSERPDTAP
ncbi:MAG TPA: hypothetical protein VNL94_04170 [Candidatus Binatia bacterium]|nr:hypothetical protein [Candidatus Binatia bacterium]